MQCKKTGVTPEIGSIYPFGGFDWRVLDVENNKALLITEKIIEQRAYNVDWTDITWENCTLREYLNGEFLNKLGVAKSAIADTDNLNSDNPWYGTVGGRATTDKVFLLSLDEVCRYFGDSGNLRNKKRYECNENGKFVPSSDGYYIHDQYNEARKACNAAGEAFWWWLRSSGGASNNAASVLGDGIVRVYGLLVNCGEGGVRPALWLNL